MLQVEKIPLLEVNQILDLNYKIKCHECETPVDTTVALIDHLKSNHSYKIELHQQTFDSHVGNQNLIYNI